MERSTFANSIAAPLFNLKENGYYTSSAGYTNARYVPLTDMAKHIYAQVFEILKTFNIEYYVFAGTLVGYIRNKKLPLWMDDFDIIIFDKDIPFFTEEISPKLIECGFNSRTVAQKFLGGGYHVLALQQSGKRTDTIEYSQDKKISVPWAQIDIFFSKVDDNDTIRNLTGWGLYHRKNVPVEWVKPAQIVEMDGLRFPTFANIEADVMEEYGDVRNELVVKTHGATFLSAAHLEWDVFDSAFSEIVNSIISPLTPSLTAEAYKAYRPASGKTCTPDPKANFDEIMLQIIQENASEVVLLGDEHVYWIMDIKRLSPDITIKLDLNSITSAKHAAHLRQFIDEVTSENPKVLDAYQSMIAALESLLGDKKFPGLRRLDELL